MRVTFCAVSLILFMCAAYTLVLFSYSEQCKGKNHNIINEINEIEVFLLITIVIAAVDQITVSLSFMAAVLSQL